MRSVNCYIVSLCVFFRHRDNVKMRLMFIIVSNVGASAVAINKL